LAHLLFSCDVQQSAKKCGEIELFGKGWQGLILESLQVEPRKSVGAPCLHDSPLTIAESSAHCFDHRGRAECLGLDLLENEFD
jgi:hypothetical protein